MLPSALRQLGIGLGENGPMGDTGGRELCRARQQMFNTIWY